MKKQVSNLTIVLLIFIAACKKDHIPQTISSYPIKVGNAWTYQRVDSVSHKMDTLMISIPGTNIVNGKSMYLWVRTSSSNIDTGYVFVNNDTVAFYENGILAGTTDLLIFPCHIGSSWSGSPSGGSLDNYICTSINDITISSKNYIGTFVLSRSQSGFDFSASEDVDMSSGIGYIYYHRHQISQHVSSIYTLSLLSCIVLE
jgi:hypothetical protein